MKYNSIHRFDQLWDAQMFVELILMKGFKYKGCDKKGGVIYSDGKKEILVYVQP